MTTQTTAIGRLTRDPVLKTYGASNDGEMSLFSIAVDTGRDETQFYDCIAFGRTAENINKYFVKGRPIHVTGIMQNNNQERDLNGAKYTNYGMTFLVREFSFIPSDNTQNDAKAAPANQAGQQAAPQGGQQANQFNNAFGAGGQQAAPAQQQQQAPATPQDNPFSGFTSDGDDGMPF